MSDVLSWFISFFLQDRLTALLDHYKQNGLTPRRKRSGERKKHLQSLQRYENISSAVTFVIECTPKYMDLCCLFKFLVSRKRMLNYWVYIFCNIIDLDFTNYTCFNVISMFRSLCYIWFVINVWCVGPCMLTIRTYTVTFFIKDVLQ